MIPIALSACNPGPMTGSGNCTWLITGRVPTLVDAGVGDPRHLDALDAALGEARLAQVVVTHGHSDHASGAAAIAVRAPGVRFFKMPWPERDSRWGVAWTTLANGDSIAVGDTTVLVVHTPGHAPDHLCLWHPGSRTLFGGDLAIIGATVYVPPAPHGDLAAYLTSLERVRELRPALILPAHGPAIDDPRALLDHYLAHRRDRENQIVEALRAGVTEPDAIVARIYVDLNVELQPRACETVVAHLEKLERDDRAIQRDGEWSIVNSEPRTTEPRTQNRTRTRTENRAPRSVNDINSQGMDQVIDFININRDRYIGELTEYLAIPSISALPQHAADVRRAGEWTADAIRNAGMQNVRLIETPGHPVVYGEWLDAPGKPTILFYGHYDVQPVDPINLWTTPPFEANVRDGEIYARGAADDKGQVFMHIKAVEACMKKMGGLPVNMKFFVEGEEEVGSLHLDEFVRAHKQDLAADVVVISDSPMFDRGIPSICYGLRGLVYFQIDLRGTKTDLHSGSFGGAVANPAFVLSQVLAQMKDRGGRVKIPGFYDDVRPLSDAERAEWKKLPFNETKYRKELGAPRLFGERGYSTLERVWARPTFEVNGLLSGFTGDGAKTVLPAVAMAKVSLRLVPDQQPDKIAELFESHVKKICPPTVELSVTRMSGGKPWMTEFDNKYVRAAGRAIEKGFGRAPVFNREGGSIPVVSTFQDELGLPSVLFGVGLPDENAHAPNEKLDLANFHNGIIASAYLYQEIAALS